MKKLYFSILIILSISLWNKGYTQQDAQYTQYMYNTISVNPAYAGSRGVFSINGLHRSQWVGLDGAPRTQTISINTPLGQSERVGLGISIVNDEIGPTRETYFDIDFSYTIPTSEKGRLSFGLKGGGHLLDVDFNKLSKFDVNDANFQQNIDNRFSPNVGVGIYYYTDKFYFGLSAPNILETEHFDESATVGNNNSEAFIARERINYYLITGYTFDLNEEVKFKPALLTKAVFGAPLQVDLSASFLLYERLTLGAGYRWSAAWSGMIGFQLSNAMMIGLGYDRETTELGKAQFNDGSYEVFIRFELFKKYSRMLTPRFF
ncbi:type IX secretion system membrane protein PorP/SprF [Aquimarina hainanensis]|uniref:Type IX secretion system membrane protein PorP/SprF n=1 Tax=Aquimarina hainanensis TaxID=1578017 RepID=A0ABW5N7G7_9FLAO|nr:type IX secretion system membrane protein PorP/SprF [Aquimarina sp. TRL1]QKX03981.1 type IX secretion system membrane protein PorP/SprF [Aquimarina sp. TRL1]